MLKEILSITGKQGLYKLVSQGKNMLIVESLIDGKRIPTYAKDKAVSLGDIAIFTETEEVPLDKVLEKVKLKENGLKASIDSKSENDELRKYMEEVLPEYDKDKVYPSDIRKLINWYNLLIESNITEFVEKEEETEEHPEKELEVKEKGKKDTKPAAAKKEPKVQVKQPKIAQKSMTNRKMGG